MQHRSQVARATSLASAATDDLVIVYNRVPKTGSTSFMGVAYDLCTANKYTVLHLNTTRNMHVMSVADQMRFVQNVTQWTAKKPAIYHGHIAYLDFAKTFDECVDIGGADCDPGNMWMQVPFFCGHDSNCWEPGNPWALQQAKHNLVNNYFLVGLTEELGDFVSILEVSLPRFFKGAQELYTSGKKSHLRKTFNKASPAPETIAKIEATRVWQMESEFYEFARDQFHFQKKRTMVETDGVLVDRGQQFMFEKIRPK
ncbi:PREDICTED: heparan sulfate 2-O-sulfotransferase 1-like [Priapulus caudatus]|uniref:Heparan sulfate 2-O-sulfotransferase 1-like n=1 Tax=Priapulus caudatus TaxID=37621 RepID=A0ABM1EZX6_PRICU|nr:PREDICTED: heparan sulfate 2-O-sulfotransferase 1-like [Priapulus caudatus]